MIRVIMAFVFLFGLSGVFAWVAVNHLSTPVVQITYPHEHCVQVKYAPGEFTCDKLPPKYVIEWVGERQ